jgi:Lysozyme like domain/LysM domain
LPQLTIQQAYDFAIAAGFSHETAITLVGIGMAESSLETQGSDGINPANAGYPESRDRGWLQINDFWHKEVTDDCAYDPECAAKAAYVISNHGTSFWPWRTFQLGFHGRYLKEIRDVVEPTPEGAQTVTIEVSKQWVTDVSTKLGIPDPFAAPAPTGAKTYIIESGDSLSGIAQKLHGNSEDWHALYDLNKAVIGDNPDLIEVGVTLTLPEGW